MRRTHSLHAMKRPFEKDYDMTRVCGQSPEQEEYSLCGDAFDAAMSEGDPDLEFVIAAPGQRITCEVCLRHIGEIYQRYTPTGKAR